jgi:hypothetical protein
MAKVQMLYYSVSSDDGKKQLMLARVERQIEIPGTKAIPAAAAIRFYLSCPSWANQLPVANT